MRAAVVAHGELAEAALGRASARLGGRPWLVVAADGGALGAARVGLQPDLVVGDADSLPASALDALRAQGIAIELAPAEKDESDTEIALRAALARGARTIVVLGALGGRRFEHALANVALLALPELDGLDVSLVDDRTSVRRVGSADGPGESTIDGQPGDLVSLQPLDARVEGVTTDGLRYPLDDEPLLLGPSRGLSNELTGRSARVSTQRGRLLVVHTERAAEAVG